MTPRLVSWRWFIIWALLPSANARQHRLCAGTHNYKNAAMPLIKPPIVIGDEVWVCADAFIGPNLTVADRVIVTAASVVVKDISESQIVGGNPAKYISAS
jgi:putative colanic acid biosynthesis acetyltransferase WcaF